MHVSPGRFSDKTDKEAKLYSINWANGIGAQNINTTDEPPVWTSEPSGLAFADATVVDGKITQVRISGGTRGQSYRVRCRVTLTGTGEVLEASTNDEPGIPMQILGVPAATRGGYATGGRY